MTDEPHDPNGLEALLGLEAAQRVRRARNAIDREYQLADGLNTADIMAARHAIDDEFAHAIRGVREHSDETRKQTKRTNRTVKVLAISIICVIFVGALFGSLLIIRGNDVEDLQNQIKAAQADTEQHQLHLCPLLDAETHSKDPRIAQAATDAARNRKCPGY